MSAVNKSLVTNLLAGALTLLALLLHDPWQTYVLNAGLFALSGALTNWLAITMLFERVPGFYGSGVIPLHFREFKLGIRKMIMQQFFNQENVDVFLAQSSSVTAKLDRELLGIVGELDLNDAFDSLLEMIMSSSFATMLSLIGGRSRLEALREPFTQRMREYLRATVDSDAFREKLAAGLSQATTSEELLRKIELIVDRRLEELTPQLVKEIVQEMIQRHLGWLVVWGGVIGGLIGVVVAFLNEKLI